MFIILCLFECIAFDLVFVNLFLVGPINLLISPNIYIMYETRGTLPGAPPFFFVDLPHGHGHYVSLFWCQPLL